MGGFARRRRANTFAGNNPPGLSAASPWIRVEPCYRNRYRALYDFYENLAFAFQPTVNANSADVFAVSIGFDVDSEDYAAFKRFWGIVRFSPVPGVPTDDFYAGYQPVILTYSAQSSAVPAWAKKCPVVALR